MHIKGIKHFDWLGSIFLAISLGTMVLVLDKGQEWGWSSTSSLISYIVATVTMIAFLFVENHEKEPVVDLKFFKNPTFAAANITSFISFMGMLGGIFLLPIFAQTYLGYSVTQSGYLFIPMAMGIMMGVQIGNRLLFKIPMRIFVSIGMFWSAVILFSFTGMDIKWTFFDIAWRLFFFALGIGTGFAPITQAATGTVPLKEIGVASSILALARNLSGAFGIAIFATILSNSITSQLQTIQKYSIINTTDPLMLRTIPALMISKANIAAYGSVFQWAAFIVCSAHSQPFSSKTQSTTAQNPTARWRFKLIICSLSMKYISNFYLLFFTINYVNNAVRPSLKRSVSFEFA